MKFVSFMAAGTTSFGAVSGNGIVDLGRRMDGIGDLREVLSAGAMAKAMELASSAATDHALDGVTLLPTIPNAEKYICIGVNYANRDAEYDNPTPAADYPSVFLRTPDSFVGHNSPLIRPPESPQLDYEGEIAIVIGKGGRRISLDDAESHIAGLTMLNEGTIRDWCRHGKFNVTQGKNFAGSGAIGPWLVTEDEFSGYDDLSITTTVNGEIRQHDNTANLSYPFRFLIHYLSNFFVLKPGDVIATGTPTGAGARFDPPRYLAPGDVVEVDCPSIGVLSNPVADEVVS
ncbi:MAG: fumarylacetoacetate hydrolase family protein [Proteobacteria bacterium]|nr:fumarylacetoacetate hydrolase family protein [Pseudomonadota bacterium]MDA1324336.1 fumarylacetoacetate hydrolase family protein [Pseudomonadota bacterium]